MVVNYLSSQLDWAGYQVSTKSGSGPSATVFTVETEKVAAHSSAYKACAIDYR